MKLFVMKLTVLDMIVQSCLHVAHTWVFFSAFPAGSNWCRIVSMAKVGGVPHLYSRVWRFIPQYYLSRTTFLPAVFHDLFLFGHILQQRRWQLHGRSWNWHCHTSVTTCWCCTSSHDVTTYCCCTSSHDVTACCCCTSSHGKRKGCKIPTHSLMTPSSRASTNGFRFHTPMASIKLPFSAPWQTARAPKALTCILPPTTSANVCLISSSDPLYSYVYWVFDGNSCD